MADLFDIYVAKKLSGGGGGDSSDFSTAEVTIATELESIGCMLPYVTSIDGTDLCTAFIDVAGTYTAILYKGNTAFVDYEAMLLGTPHTITATGNATARNAFAYHITGDCTITIS